MKFIVIIPFLILALVSCKHEPKVLSEDFQAIAYDGRDHEISINDTLVFEVPKLKGIVFLYHDSIFKVEIDHKNKQHFSLIKANNKSLDSLISLFKSYQKTNLVTQLKEIKEHGIAHGCYKDGYFLFSKQENLQFGLFEFEKYYNWRLRYDPVEIPLKPEQFPKIYQTIYHTFNSKWKDYYLSNEYHYKELRIHYSSPHIDK